MGSRLDIYIEVLLLGIYNVIDDFVDISYDIFKSIIVGQSKVSKRKNSGRVNADYIFNSNYIHGYYFHNCNYDCFGFVIVNVVNNGHFICCNNLINTVCYRTDNEVITVKIVTY